MDGAAENRLRRALAARRRMSALLGLAFLVASLTACVPQAVTDDADGAPATRAPALPDVSPGFELPPESVAVEFQKPVRPDSPLAGEIPSAGGVSARWLEGRAQFAVVLWVSGSCPWVPVSVETGDPATISVGFVPFETSEPDYACTADAVRSAYIFDSPAPLADGEVTAVLSFEHDDETATEEVRVQPSASPG